jgi:hypothetical protein
MAVKTTGSRFNLGEPLTSDLADFAAAHYKASETEIIRVALRAFIDERLAAEKDMKARFDEARRKRLGDLS